MSRPDNHHPRRAPLGLWALVFLAVGLLASLACAAGAYFRPQFFFPSYLVAWLFFLGIALGSLAVSMLHHLTGGDWGRGIRRLVESAAATLILLGLLFLPLVLGLEELYVWARREVVQHDDVLASKARYLNVDFFCQRAGIYFLIWIVLAFVLNRWSADRRRERAGGRRLQLLSGPGLAMYGLSMTFAAIDWGMSLDPHWFSSMYGVIVIAGQGVAGLSFTILVLVLMAGYEPFHELATVQRLHDLGNLLLAFVMFWAYVAFMQYLIIWSGNLPEETPWYVHRSTYGWQYVAWSLIALHFAVPFLLLLSRNTKRHARRLAQVAGLLLVMRLVDIVWLVIPTFTHEGHGWHWLNAAALAAALAAVGGLWLAMFTWRLAARSRLPSFEPAHEEVLDVEPGQHAPSA